MIANSDNNDYVYIHLFLVFPNTWEPKTQTLNEKDISDQWPILLTWFNFNPSMDK